MAKNVKVIKVKTLDDMIPMPKGVARLKRGDKVLEIPIKGVSLKKQQEIEAKYTLPDPPMQSRKLPGMAKVEYMENPDDPKYRQQVKKIQDDAGHELILEGVDIEIEGKTIEEQWQKLLDTGLAAGDASVLTRKILELSNITSGDIEGFEGFFV